MLQQISDRISCYRKLPIIFLIGNVISKFCVNDILSLCKRCFGAIFSHSGQFSRYIPYVYYNAFTTRELYNLNRSSFCFNYSACLDVQRFVCLRQVRNQQSDPEQHPVAIRSPGLRLSESIFIPQSVLLRTVHVDGLLLRRISR